MKSIKHQGQHLGYIYMHTHIQHKQCECDFFFICRYFHAEDNIASTKSCDQWSTVVLLILLSNF